MTTPYARNGRSVLESRAILGLSLLAVAACQLDLPQPSGVEVRRPDGAGLPDAAGDAVRDAADGASADAPCATPEVVTVGGNAADDFADRVVDTMLDATQPTRNFGAEDQIEADDGPMLCLFRFDLDGTLPPGRALLAVRLLLTTADNASTDAFALQEVLEDWQEGEASWDLRRAGTPWSSPGCGTPDSRAEDVLALVRPSETDTRYPVAIDVALVRRWLDQPTSNHGLALAPLGGDGAQFQSKEGRDGARPALELTYCP